MNDEPDQRARAAPGVPAEDGIKRLRIGETEPRAMGLPLSWFRTTEPIDLRWVRHPYRWLHWRLEVHRHGPYAPRFEDFHPR